MSPKLFAFLTWIFYLAERRTSDEIWLVCMLYSAVLAVCAFFYHRENQPGARAGKGKVPKSPRDG